MSSFIHFRRQIKYENAIGNIVAADCVSTSDSKDGAVTGDSIVDIFQCDCIFLVGTIKCKRT